MTEYKVNVNDMKLHHFENIIEIEREVDVGKHLPQQIIGKGEEFTEIRRVENVQLTKLWDIANRLMKNTYIQSSDEKGIFSYEKLIDVFSSGNLEEKRKAVYAIWNLSNVWTHRTLEQWMDSVFGREHYHFELIYDKYIFELEVINSKIDEFFIKKIRRIIPSNLVIQTISTMKAQSCFASVFLSAEVIEVYPYQSELIELPVAELIIPVGANTGVEEGTIFPLLFRLDGGLLLDSGFHFDEHA